MERTKDKEWTRRSLLEWLGKGAVLGLGASLLKSCGTIGNAVADGGDADQASDGHPTGETAEGHTIDPPPAEPACKAGRFNFRPGSESDGIYRTWNVRTVDPQDIGAILDRWRLKVDGLVEQPAEFSFADMIALPRQDQVTDLHCVEGWSVLDIPWNGVHLSTILDRVKPRPEASHVNFHTLGDIYNESLPLAVALEPRTLLAYGVDCNTLPLGHGFPLRLVVPRKWAYKSAKFVYRIELADAPVLGYWERYGYTGEGDIPSDRLRPGKY